MARLRAVERHVFDVAIIGGGIVGCGIARDAALRGLSVALFEQHDFGSGTTSGSTRIVHGGLRYLATADFTLVRMDLAERETLLRIAPHLVRPLQFVIPFRAVSAAQRLKLRLGLLLYDGFALGSSLPRHRASWREAAYYDARVDSPERLCLENVVDAAAHGAQVFNYVEVCGVVRDAGRVAGVRVRDRLSGHQADVRARAVVNASGPWFERAAQLVGGPLPGRIRTTKGVHLVCAPLTDRAEVHFSRLDGRMMFAIPRLGQTWLGTTDTDYGGDPAAAVATRDDVDYVIESFKDAFPALHDRDVRFTTAGVRALVMRPGNASAVSRLHRIVDGEFTGNPGLVSIMGAKITGYRAIAEEATDVICRRLGVRRPCSTAEIPLPGARTDGAPAAPEWGHLRNLYGSRADGVTSLAASQPELRHALSPSYEDIAAQVVFAARHEYCVTIADFIKRRTLLGATADQGWSAVPAVAERLAGELGWTPSHRQRQIEAYADDIKRSVGFRNSP